MVSFGQARKVSGKQRVVEVDGRASASAGTRHARSTFVVGRQRRPEAALKLVKVRRARGTARMPGVHVAHRVAVRGRLELIENPRNEPVELVFVDR